MNDFAVFAEIEILIIKILYKKSIKGWSVYLLERHCPKSK
jgi:hypothetical protein